MNLKRILSMFNIKEYKRKKRLCKYYNSLTDEERNMHKKMFSNIFSKGIEKLNNKNIPNIPYER